MQPEEAPSRQHCVHSKALLLEPSDIKELTKYTSNLISTSR